MAITRIILWLGNSCVLCAVLLAVTALSAFFMLDFSSAGKVAAIALTSGVMGATLIATTYNTPSQERNADALLFLLIFWCFIPLIGAMPYMMLGATDDYISAYFEAVSAFTTTGASALIADDLPQTLLLWRSILQWFGGVSVATFAVVILAALNLAGTGIHRSALFTLKTGDLFTRGLAPETGPLAGYVGRVSALILGIFCVIGAMNISVIWDLLRLRRLRNVMSMFKNVEHRGLIVMAALLSLFGLFYVGFNHAFTLVVESLYFVSTAGFDYNVIGIEMLPPVILIAIALMGGSALSTAGGVKIIRMLLLFRHLSTDMSRLSHPSRIVPVSFKSQHIPDRAFLSIWMYFFGYTLFFGVSILAIGATGLSFEDAVATGAASLSNMGPLLPATLPESGLTYVDFTALQKGVSAIFMLIGRVEVLAVLILFTPSFWVR